ncbi:MAG: hypothetical protein OEU86_08920 [Gammaproteobacteria bacterium]|nr:hypothetical protein [Gammaproteobacteria bacterium]
MSFLLKVWRGEYSLNFTFWVMGCVFPTPIFATKYYLKEAGVLTHQDQLIFLAGQAFLWLEWSYFAFITVALWNASRNQIRRAAEGEDVSKLWGQAGRALAVASGVLALGSFANLSGLTSLIFGHPLFIGLGAG